MLGRNGTREAITHPGFEQAIMPHLDAAYNLARWLMSNDRDAEDVVQEACLRAFRFFGAFRGGNSRAWFLAIVRNTSYTWRQQNQPQGFFVTFDEEIHGIENGPLSPDEALIQKADLQLLRQALGELPMEFREALVLRELEGFSYKEIADIVGIPTGTVMSRRARARKRLLQKLQKHVRKER